MSTQEKLARAIIDILGDDKREAISYVHTTLRQDGWRRLGNLNNFREMVERLGFIIQTGYNERNQRRTEIALPEGAIE